ncbi:hypothetical protein [Jeotgalicoccus meleagridis]|uniref:Uncharacterized protein n=1 Tax=Jeotgalicoccus meleagridis TaxID=2759181 RepID=A0A6V7R3K7_9STAP|nr:hypothetical protein [Jeotgalicoccus meleagridis]CAD2071512.1 hypothetical protein JEODO184_00278 [Jeotgalicoccus meleagridis]
MKYIGEEFNELKRRRLGTTFSLSENTTFTLHDLKVNADICSPTPK